MPWLEQFRAETAPVIAEPFLLCLAEAIASVESARGERAIRAAAGFSEIGMKAVPGRPSVASPTLEADASGALVPQTARFRLFADRDEQAHALLYLMRSSSFYEAARLLYALAFYAAYAPGRSDGQLALIRVFNAIAATGAHPGVRPFSLAAMPEVNRAAAREAVRRFAELASSKETFHG